MGHSKHRYIGLIPAAGHATRLQNLSSSKEIYSLQITDKKARQFNFPVCKCLIDSFQNAGIDDIYMIIRQGKEDIIDKLGDGEQYGVKINYLYTEYPYGPPYSLDRAYSFIENKYVALGFPDILFKPNNVFKTLIDKQQRSNADVVLGLFRAPRPEKMDMIDIDHQGRIKSIEIKPSQTSLQWTWVIAVWNSKFSTFMHQCLYNLLNEFKTKQRNECHVGNIFQMALQKDISFDSVCFEDGDLIDIGTPEDLALVNQKYSSWLE